MPPAPDTLEQAYQFMKVSFISTLTSNAAEAFVNGEVRASKRLGMALDFGLINSRAVSATRDYRETLERFGGSDITVVGDDGIARRVFKPWLDDMIDRDKQRVGSIIQDAVRSGSSINDIEKSLKTVFSNSEHNARLVAYQETKALYNKGTMERYNHENVQQGIWHHMDPQDNPREDHQELDGKTFDLDDPVWDLMNEPNCHCWCEPVLFGGLNNLAVPEPSAFDKLASTVKQQISNLSDMVMWGTRVSKGKDEPKDAIVGDVWLQEDDDA